MNTSVTEQEKDEIAASVLALVREVRRLAGRHVPARRDEPEPTGVFVHPSDRRAVDTRA